MEQSKTVTIVEGQDMTKVSKFNARVKVSRLKPIVEEYSLAQVEQLIQGEHQQIVNLNNGIKIANARIEELTSLKNEIEKAVLGA